MTPEQFIKDTENHLYKEVAKTTNLIMGKNKTAQLSTGLFLKLPISVTLEKVSAPLPKLYKELTSFIKYFSAYVKLNSNTQVNFVFFYHNEKDLDSITTHLFRHSTFFAFVYLHEIQHILRKHTTTSYESMMKCIAGNAPNVHELINVAEDYAINYSLKQLLKTSPLAKDWVEISTVGLHSQEYEDKNMSDIDILKDLLSKPDNDMEVSSFCDGFNTVTMDGKTSNQPVESTETATEDTSDGKDTNTTSKPDKCSTASDDIDAALSDLAESLQDIISSNTKGSKAGELFEQLFSAIKVETGWFKKIKSSFKRQVYYKTHDFNTSWANINNTYRRIYKAPKKQFIDTKLNIILSVDHSGSMRTEDLQKLLYLIESESKRITSLTVLIHDYDVQKEFVITNEYDIAANPEFKEALATRYASGGTSHKCVFEHISNMKIKDTSTIMYMSFSDNYSDIEETFRNYPIMNKLTNFWVCTENNPVKVAGTNVTMI